MKYGKKFTHYIAQLSKNNIDLHDLYKNNDEAHKIPHIKQVFECSFEIASYERKKSVDEDVLAYASLLHDIGISIVGRDTHHLKGSEMANEILSKADLDLTEDQIKKIKEAISQHRYSKKWSIEPTCIESYILRDSDNLAGTGKERLARIDAYGSAHGEPHFDPDAYPKGYEGGNGKTSTITWVYSKIMRICPNTCSTKGGKELARGRWDWLHNYCVNYVKNYDMSSRKKEKWLNMMNEIYNNCK